MSNGNALMQMTVTETIRRFPGTVEIFSRYGIDACCGGAVPVAEAAARDGADPSALQADLLSAVREAVMITPRPS